MKQPQLPAIVEMLHARIAEGCSRFPLPAANLSHSLSTTSETEDRSQHSDANVTIPESTESLLAQMAVCTKCALCNERSRVVVAAQLLPNQILLLSDFPEKADENAHANAKLFCQEASHHNVLQRMISYLKIDDRVHRSFALKCVPNKTIPSDALQSCSKLLQIEISCVQPEVIICAGFRPLQLLARLSNTVLETTPEVGEVGSLPIEGQFRRILVIPAARELEALDKWRAPVATFLKQALAHV